MTLLPLAFSPCHCIIAFSTGLAVLDCVLGRYGCRMASSFGGGLGAVCLETGFFFCDTKTARPAGSNGMVCSGGGVLHLPRDCRPVDV